MIRAYEAQIEVVEGLGGRIILMASRALATAAAGPEDYVRVYDRILAQVREPVIIHWLGEMFDPALEGYWGSGDHGEAMEACLEVIASHAGKVDGVKVSLLSKEKEIAMRRRLPAGVRMYTGDDFNYAELIAGDAAGHSDALLGIFDAIAPAASAALAALARGGENEFFDILAPTVPLSRHIFRAPTRFYKTGVVFLAYLNGLQDHFVMVGGQESARSLVHLAELFRLADQARVLGDPELAAARMARVLACRRSHERLVEGLSINLATVRAQWDLRQAVDGCLRHGINAVAPWRDQVAVVGLEAAARLVRDSGVRVTGLCRGGFFPAPTAAERARAAEDNRRAVDEAAALGADCLVMVVGGLAAGSKDLGRGAGDGARRAGGALALCPGGRGADRDRAAASGLCGGPLVREHAGAGA